MAIFHPAVQYLQVILELLTNISPSYIPYILSHARPYISTYFSSALAHFQRVWEFVLLFAKPLTNYCYCLNVRDFLFSNPIDNFLSIIFDLSICWNNGLIHTKNIHTQYVYIYRCISSKNAKIGTEKHKMGQSNVAFALWESQIFRELLFKFSACIPYIF